MDDPLFSLMKGAICVVFSNWSVLSPPQGNDITLVARLPWQRRQQGSRETKQFEVVFKEVSVPLKHLLKVEVYRCMYR